MQVGEGDERTREDDTITQTMHYMRPLLLRHAQHALNIPHRRPAQPTLICIVCRIAAVAVAGQVSGGHIGCRGAQGDERGAI
jgi:hypothetical protein